MSAGSQDVKIAVEKNLKLNPIIILFDPYDQIFKDIREIIYERSIKGAVDKLVNFLNSKNNWPEDKLTLLYLYILYESVLFENIHIVKEIFSLNTKINEYINCFFIPRTNSMNYRDGELVSSLPTGAVGNLSAGTFLGFPSTLLGLAVFNGNFSMVQFLVKDINANLDAFTRSNMTLLHELLLGCNPRRLPPHLEDRILIAQYLLNNGASLQALSIDSSNNLYRIQAEQAKVDSDNRRPRSDSDLIPREVILCELEKNYHRIKASIFKEINEIFKATYPNQCPFPRLIFEYLHGNIKINPQNEKNVIENSFSMISRACEAVTSISPFEKAAALVPLSIPIYAFRNYLVCRESSKSESEYLMCCRAEGETSLAISTAIPVVTYLFCWGVVKYKSYRKNNECNERLDKLPKLS